MPGHGQHLELDAEVGRIGAPVETGMVTMGGSPRRHLSTSGNGHTSFVSSRKHRDTLDASKSIRNISSPSCARRYAQLQRSAYLRVRLRNITDGDNRKVEQDAVGQLRRAVVVKLAVYIRQRHAALSISAQSVTPLLTSPFITVLPAPNRNRAGPS